MRTSQGFKTLIKWVVTLALLALVGRAVLSYEAAHEAPQVVFSTTKVDRGRIVAKVTATGTLSALVTVQVGSQVSGRIQQLLVDFNSVVKKGQVIAKLDPQLLQAAREQARANCLVAQSNVAKAQAQALDAARQYERDQALLGQHLVAQADVDTAETNADVARAAVDAASSTVAQTQAALHQADLNLGYTTIVSPIDGIVVSRNVDVGQTVAASLQAPTLFVLAEDLRKMQVDTSVAEADVGRLRSAMAATFLVDAYPGEVFHGTIRQIRNAPQTVQNVVTYDAVIDVGNPELKLRPGMTANVTFVFAENANALRIPNAALLFRPESELLRRLGAAGPSAENGARGAERRRADNRRTVWILSAGKPHPASIVIGISDGSYSEVVEGQLHEGNAVITDVSGPGAGTTPTRRPFGRLF